MRSFHLMRESCVPSKAQNPHSRRVLPLLLSMIFWQRFLRLAIIYNYCITEYFTLIRFPYRSSSRDFPFLDPFFRITFPFFPRLIIIASIIFVWYTFESLLRYFVLSIAYLWMFLNMHISRLSPNSSNILFLVILKHTVSSSAWAWIRSPYFE